MSRRIRIARIAITAALGAALPFSRALAQASQPLTKAVVAARVD